MAIVEFCGVLARAIWMPIPTYKLNLAASEATVDSILILLPSTQPKSGKRQLNFKAMR